MIFEVGRKSEMQLNRIISARSSQRNFQIICITHDEAFVHMLGKNHLIHGSNPGYYWRISREELYVGLNMPIPRLVGLST